MRPLLVTWLLVLVVLAIGCSSDGESPSGADAAASASTSAPSPSKRPVYDREEQQRRAEAVRRAAEEMASRGIRTDEYLLNLIADEEVYRVAFVKRSGRDLRAEITVRVRREDFEILGAEGPALESGDR